MNCYDLAKRVAMRSNVRMRMGAVVSRRSRPLSVGFNKRKTHPKSKARWPSIHAELDAILGVPREELQGAEITVVRVTKTGILASSRPCESCFDLLKEVGIERMHYVNVDRQLHTEAL